jgi:hypothetical protein
MDSMTVMSDVNWTDFQFQLSNVAYKFTTDAQKKAPNRLSNALHVTCTDTITYIYIYIIIQPHSLFSIIVYHYLQRTFYLLPPHTVRNTLLFIIERGPMYLWEQRS